MLVHRLPRQFLLATTPLKYRVHIIHSFNNLDITSRRKGLLLNFFSVPPSAHHARLFHSSRQSFNVNGKSEREVVGDNTPANIKLGEPDINLEQDKHEHHQHQQQTVTEIKNNKQQPNLIYRIFNLSNEEANSASLKEVKRLLTLAKKDVRLFVLAMTLLTLTAAIIMSLPKVTGSVLDATKLAIQNSNETGIKYDDLTVYGYPIDSFLLYLAAALTVATAATFCRTLLMRIIGENLVSRLRLRLMKHVLRQDGEFYDKNKVGDLISRLSSDAYVVSKSITYNMSDGVKHSIVLSSSLGMMFYLSPTLSLVMLAFAPPLLFASWIYGLKVRALSRQLQKATGDLTKVAEQELNSIKTIQCFNAEPRETHRYGEQIQQVWNVSFKDAFTNATFYSATGMLGNTTFLLTLALGARLVMDGSMTIGDLTAYMIYTEYCGSATFGLASFYTELFKGAGAASRLFDILDLQPNIDPIHGSKLAKPVQGKIKFENVTFAYPTRPDNIIFKNLSFEIAAGSNVCIVGPSGRGKSTIASLLLKMYQPQEGRILIDGIDIAQLSTSDLRHNIGYVQQEPTLIEGSIYDNIIYSLPLTERNSNQNKSSRHEVEFIAQRANCDFIPALPQGLDTKVGARGGLLSGGQRQKLAIARALIKEPGILILDEATSALDAGSESIVNINLNRWAKSIGGLRKSIGGYGVTRMSIAHRASTIRSCDEVVVLGYEGNVVEQGRVIDLWDDKNSFLWKLVRAKKSNDHANVEDDVEAQDKVGKEETEEDQIKDKKETHRLSV
ncbi:ATP-binding cassette permease [Martiniozyma asiatica (nom. inval.)]|nr:ATP-binding cassette permease [Martiniozyma asiatica]